MRYLDFISAELAAHPRLVVVQASPGARNVHAFLTVVDGTGGAPAVTSTFVGAFA